MKQLFSNKLVMAILFFAAGGLSVWGIDRVLENKHAKEVASPFSEMHKDPQQFFDDFFNDDFFGKSKDPFEEMRRMQKQMLQLFNEQGQFQSSFDNWYQKRFGGGDIGELKQREDENFIYYDLELNGQTPKAINVEVDGGHISISGQVETRQENGNMNQYFSSSFQRTFPVPAGVDAENFKMEQAENKIIIKFPKTKGS